MSGVGKVKMVMAEQRHIIIGWMRLFDVKAGVVLLLVMTFALVA